MTASKLVLNAASGVGGAGLEVEDVFRTYLYDGTGSTQTITNGVDLNGEGGLVWIKSREIGYNSQIYDTARGATYYMETTSTNASVAESNGLTAFNNSGFSIGSDAPINHSNNSGYVSWTFRKAPKFFDVVTYTGTGSTTTISHNLGAVPGMIIIKCTSGTGNWRVYHRGLDGGNAPEDYVLLLNGNNEQNNSSSYWNDTAPTSTHFTVAGDDDVNDFGDTFVAYLFAHNDGDGNFGPDADQDIIKCGQYQEQTGANVVNLGFEPQFLLIKKYTASGDWWLIDTMRGMTANGSNALLRANTGATEVTSANNWEVTPTGFANYESSGSGANYIYMAIRKGQLSIPENSTDVFSMAARDTSKPHFNSTSSEVDMAWKIYQLSGYGDSWKKYITSRLQGNTHLIMNSTNQEGSNNENTWDHHNGWSEDPGSSDYYSWMWKRAPSYFDVVGYKATSGADTIGHNLGVAPEMIWIKNRDDAGNAARQKWVVYHSSVSSGYLNLHDTVALQTDGAASKFGNGSSLVSPTATTFTVADDYDIGRNGYNYMAYLFASADGVSKLGSFSHTSGSATNVDCGFSNGSRFILIKRTDSTSDWRFFDSVKGIVSGNDPYLQLNNNDAETSGDFVDPLSSGFTVTGNYDTGTYIFYAIA
jgi:hypothetical protein